MASNTAPKTILLSGNPGCYEGVANAAIRPGDLIEVMTTGKLRKHATAAGVASALFAREEEYVGGDIDTDYAANDQVAYWSAKKGDRFYAWLKNGENAALGAFLESGGNGSLQVTTHGTGSATTAAAWPVARALEAVDNSGGGTGPNSTARIKVEVL
jgi:hypothetical protein